MKKAIYLKDLIKGKIKYPVLNALMVVENYPSKSKKEFIKGIDTQWKFVRKDLINEYDKQMKKN